MLAQSVHMLTQSVHMLAQRCVGTHVVCDAFPAYPVASGRRGRPRLGTLVSLGIQSFTPDFINACVHDSVRAPRYNPQDVGRVARLLQAGAVMGRRFQPHEAHIPFLLQLKASKCKPLKRHANRGVWPLKALPWDWLTGVQAAAAGATCSVRTQVFPCKSAMYGQHAHAATQAQIDWPTAPYSPIPYAVSYPRVCVAAPVLAQVLGDRP
jgi:hypothetical protein